MQVIEKLINEIKPYEKNPRKNDEAVEYVANSIKEFGFKVPIVIDKSNVICSRAHKIQGGSRLICGDSTDPAVIDRLAAEITNSINLFH